MSQKSPAAPPPGRRQRLRLALVTVASAMAIFLAALWFRPTLTVGVILSRDSALGQEIEETIRFYMARNTTMGKVPVRFIFKSPPLERKAIIRAYQDLERSGADVIMGGELSFAGVILADEAARSGVPTLGLVTATSLVSRRKDRFFRLFMGTDVEGRQVAEFFMKKGVERLAVVHAPHNLEYGLTFAKAVARFFKGQSVIIPSARDLTEPSRLSAFKPQAVFLIMPGKDVTDFAGRAWAASSGTMLVSSSWGANLGLTPPHTAMQGMIVATPVGPPVPRYSELLRSLGLETGLNPTYASLYALSWMDILSRAVAESGPRRDDLAAWLEQPRTHQTAYGPVFMDGFGDACQEYYYFHWLRGDAFVLLEKMPVIEKP